MATSSKVDRRFSEILQCPLCLETLKRPKLLPCGHTYCASCLQLHIDKKLPKKGTIRVLFPCPVCKADTAPFDSTVNIEQWAEVFPVNNMVNSIYNVPVDSLGDNMCYLCSKAKRQNLGISYCNECKISMCRTCSECHGSLPSTSHHDVINLDGEKESLYVRPTLDFIEMCLRHPSKPIEFFCWDHTVMCCCTCGFLEHRKCGAVSTLDDIMNTLKTDSLLKEIENNLQNFHTHVESLTAHIKQNVDTIQKCKKEILQEITSVRSQFEATIQKLEGDVNASLEENHKSEELNLCIEETNGCSFIFAIKRDLANIAQVIKYGSKVQKAILICNVNQSQHRHFKAIHEHQNNINDIRLTFEIDQTFRDFILYVEKLGKINITRRKTVLPPCPKVKTSHTGFDSVYVFHSDRSPLKDRNAKKAYEFNVKVSDDVSSCHISDILHLQDCRLLLVDNWNSKLKIFGTDNTLSDSYKLLGKPWNVCALSDKEVAVTIPEQKTIEIIKIEDKLSKTKDIETKLECWGVAALQDQLVVSTNQDGHYILILNMDGREIKRIRQDSFQNKKLLSPLFVRSDVIRNIVYVSYHSGNMLVAYNGSWDVVFSYMNGSMNSPSHIDTDREGNIYLCGYTSCSVQQISADGKFIKRLESGNKGKKHPLTIRFYRYMDKFVLSYGECDIVNVYELCK